MRKAALLIAVLTLFILAIAFYPTYVEKPILNGTGPLSVQIDPRFPAPETHKPLDWWQTHHMDVVNRGDLEKIDCLYCHEPRTSCNNCHGYVGVDPILLTPTP
jgi:hypothetical protein